MAHPISRQESRAQRRLGHGVAMLMAAEADDAFSIICGGTGDSQELGCLCSLAARGVSDLLFSMGHRGAVRSAGLALAYKYGLKVRSHTAGAPCCSLVIRQDTNQPTHNEARDRVARMGTLLERSGWQWWRAVGTCRQYVTLNLNLHRRSACLGQDNGRSKRKRNFRVLVKVELGLFAWQVDVLHIAMSPLGNAVKITFTL